MFPVTDKADKVPTEVIFDCAAAVTVPAVVALVASATVPLTLAPATAFAVVANVASDAEPTVPETLAPATAFAVVANATAPETLAPATAFAEAAMVALEANPLRAPTNVVAANDPLAILAVYTELAYAIAVPEIELENCAYTTPVVTVVIESYVATFASGTVPVTLAPAIADNPDPLPVNTPVLAVNATPVVVPLTPKLVKVPTEVMFGCAAVVTVPAVVAEVALVASGTVPVTLAPGIDVNPVAAP